jgi:hypothetical protein
MKTFIVLNQDLHPEDLDFVVAVYQAENFGQVEKHLMLQGYSGEFDIREEELIKIV